MECAFFALLLAFAAWLMFRSFRVVDHTMLIGFKFWSDFAANLPLIRSFSMGWNWPPEYPIFPGEPIRYHFLFFALVGTLERLGLPLDYALNLPSILGFFTLLVMLYLVTVLVFRDRRAGVLAVVYFLFNGSMTFVSHFATHGWNPRAMTALWRLRDYPNFGPFDGSEILGVWNLHVFINQRHFAFALAFLLVFVWFTLAACDRPPRRQALWGAVFGGAMGLLPLFHKPVLLVFAVCLAVYFFMAPRLRHFLLTAGVSSLAVMVVLSELGMTLGTGGEGVGARWAPGFLASRGDHLSLIDLVRFWWLNWGLHIVMMPVALVLARRRFLGPRSPLILVAPALIVFALGSLFQFSVELLANHKLFNAAFLLLVPLSAYTIVRLLDFGAGLRPGGRLAVWSGAALLVLFSVLGGIVDLMPIKNDSTHYLSDVAASPEAQWFVENTSPDAVVLNSHFLYHPASVAGRKIFLGWGYFTWGAGYDHDGRMAIMAEMYGSDHDRMCALLEGHDIQAVTVEDAREVPGMVPIDLELFGRFPPDFESMGGRFKIYHVSTLCSLPREAPEVELVGASTSRFYASRPRGRG